MAEEDLQEVCAIESVSFPNPWPETTFRGEIQNRTFSFPYVIVHKLQERVIGYIIYWLIGEEAQINNIALHPDFRLKGIGETVLRKIIDKLRDNGVRFISLEVRPSNESAQSLYYKLGFRLMGIRKNYYTNPQENALVLGLSLD